MKNCQNVKCSSSSSSSKKNKNINIAKDEYLSNTVTLLLAFSAYIIAASHWRNVVWESCDQPPPQYHACLSESYNDCAGEKERVGWWLR